MSSPPDPALFEADLACDSSDFFNDSTKIPLSFSPALSSPVCPAVDDDEAGDDAEPSGANLKAD